jgi:hypothetical protein
VGCFGWNGGEEEKLMNGGFAGENESDGFFFLCVGVAGDEKAKNDRGCFLGSTVLMV